MAWPTVGAEIGIVSESIASSIALIVFGLDSMIELFAGREAICEILMSCYAAWSSPVCGHICGAPNRPKISCRSATSGCSRPSATSTPGCGDSLAAYAQPCIGGESERHFRGRCWQLRVLRQDQELLLEVRAAEETMTQRLGRTPGDRDLAWHLAVTENDVREGRRAGRAFTTCPLDAPLSHSDDPALLADTLGEDDPAVAHAADIQAVHAYLDDGAVDAARLR